METHANIWFVCYIYIGAKVNHIRAMLYQCSVLLPQPLNIQTLNINILWIVMITSGIILFPDLCALYIYRFLGNIVVCNFRTGYTID